MEGFPQTLLWVTPSANGNIVVRNSVWVSTINKYVQRILGSMRVN